MSYAGGLLGCFSDFKVCLCGTFCSLCLNGYNHAKVREEEPTLCHCCLITHPYWNRKDVLKKAGETSSDLKDCLLTCFCAPCVICQDARQLGTLNN